MKELKPNKVARLIEKAKKSIRNSENNFVIPEVLTNNRDAMLEILGFITGRSWGYDFQKDNRVQRFVEFIDKDLLQNEDFMLKACEMKFENYSSTLSILNYIKNGYSKDIALALVKKDPENLRRMKIFHDDEDIVMAGVRRDGMLLHVASDDLRDNFDVVRVAINKNPEAIQYGSDRARSDFELGKYAVSKSARAYRYLAENLHDNKDITLIAVKDPEVLAIVHASERLRNDRDVAREAVRANGAALECLSADKRSEHEIVSYAIGHSPAFIKNASNRYLYSEPLLFKAVLQTADVLEYVPEEMRKVMVEMLDNYESANGKVHDDDENSF